MALRAGCRRAAATQAGRVWELLSWGRGASGALGHGGEADEYAPRAVAGLSKALAEDTAGAVAPAVVSGLFHAAAVDLHGRAWSWGRGSGGRLAQGDEEPAYEPQLAGGLRGVRVAQAALGGLHSAFVTAGDAELLTSGFGQFGALGGGDFANRLAPARVAAPFGGGGVRAAACGGAHTLALDLAGEIWAFGRDEGDGRLGVPALAEGGKGGSNVPVKVDGVEGVSLVACGGFASFAFGARCGLLSFGGNQNGELGREGAPWAPGEVAGLEGEAVDAVAAGGFHALALVRGDVLSWGFGGRGALGNGGMRSVRHPARVGGALAGKRVVRIAAGAATSYAVTEDGELYAWGRNGEGQCGLGPDSEEDHVVVPTRVPLERRALDVAAGAVHALCVVGD